MTLYGMQFAYRSFVATSALVGLLPFAFDGGATYAGAQMPLVADVALSEHGHLRGRLADAAGRPRGDAVVLLCDGQRNCHRAVTDKQGRFDFPGVAGGCYQLIYRDQTRVVRAWTATAAPPAASPVVHWIVDPLVVRGQRTAPRWLNEFVQQIKVGATKPAVVGTVLAASVGIPVFVHNVQQDNAPMSP